MGLEGFEADGFSAVYLLDSVSRLKLPVGNRFGDEPSALARRELNEEETFIVIACRRGFADELEG